jgi:hypothetical protein
LLFFRILNGSEVYLPIFLLGDSVRELIAHDEEIRKSEISIRKQKEAEDRFRAVYAELKYSDKANEMRQQEMLKQRLSLAFRTGDKRTTEILLDRLRSNDDLKEFQWFVCHQF